MKIKKGIVLFVSLMVALVGTTIVSAATYPTSMAGPISPGTSWKSHDLGLKKGDGVWFRLTNYRNYGTCTRTAFAVRTKSALDGESEKVWGGDTNSTGRISKDGTQRRLAFSKNIKNGRYLCLRYKIPSDESAVSDSAYVEYYWFV